MNIPSNSPKTSPDNLPDPATPKSNNAPPSPTVGALGQGKIIGGIGHGKSWHLKSQRIKAINELKTATPGSEDEKPPLIIEEEWHPAARPEKMSPEIEAALRAIRSHPPILGQRP